MIIQSRRNALVAAIAAAAALAGAIVALHYHRVGLTLSHYDARGHLVVARRIADSITPGWQQVGAVWLPLPHLLNALPVQIDAFYRTGASGVAISVLSFAVATGGGVSIGSLESPRPPPRAGGGGGLGPGPTPTFLPPQPPQMTEPLLIA